MREWRCSCGVTVPEEGDGAGFKEMKDHQAFKAGHKILGLYAGTDVDADILVVGPKKKTAIEMGYMADPTPPKDPDSPESTPTKKKKKSEVGNLALGVPFAQIRMKPAVWGWISLIMPACRTDAGTPYDTDNEGVAEWIYDVIEWFGRQSLAMQYHLDMESRTIEDIVRRMRDGIAVQADTTLLSPDATATNAEDVTQDVMDLIATQANAMVGRMAQNDEEEDES